MEDKLGAGRNVGAVSGLAVTEKVAHQMHLAALPGRVVEVPGDGFREPSMLIRDHVRDALESARLEPAEGFVPGGKAFGIPDPDAQNLPESVAAHPGHDQRCAHHHAIGFPALDEQGINQDERVVPFQAPFVESPNPRIQPDAQRAHRGFGKTRTT